MGRLGRLMFVGDREETPTTGQVRGAVPEPRPASSAPAPSPPSSASATAGRPSRRRGSPAVRVAAVRVAAVRVAAFRAAVRRLGGRAGVGSGP